MRYLAISLYCISLLAQFAAVILSVSLIKKARSYHLGWLFLGIAFTLMLGRRVSPIHFALNSGQYNMLDALLSVPISVFLLLGAINLKGLIEETEQLNNLLNETTKTDYLTFALSREEAIKRTILEMARSERTKRPFALLSLDIDYFKRINDEFGHQVGDAVLKNMVGFIKSQIRSNDFIGRMGGEEFIIVLPETNEVRAMDFGDRLRKSISDFSCYIEADKEIKITVSIGIVVVFFNRTQNEYSELLQFYLDRADAAMYEAKKNGRNQCHLGR